MLKGTVDELYLVGRRSSAYRAAPVVAGSGWIGSLHPSQGCGSYRRVRIIAAAPDAAEGTWLERLEPNLGLRHWNTIVLGCGGESELG